MVYYSTLKEAFNVDTFNSSKKSKKQDIDEPFLNDYSTQDDCYFKKQYGIDTGVCKNNVAKFTNSPAKSQNNLREKNTPANVETSKLSMYSTEITDADGYSSHTMNKQGQSCTPLQAPNYEYPIDNKCKQNHTKAMKIYTDDNKVNVPTYDEFNKNLQNKNIQPYYDEDLEQYFDINNMTDAINYKSNSETPIESIRPTTSKTPTALTPSAATAAFYPTTNKNSYMNNNTNEYSEPDMLDDDLLRTPEYNLSKEDRSNALQALATLKDIENKMNRNNQLDNTKDFKLQSQQQAQQQQVQQAAYNQTNKSAFYNNLVNAGLFIFIGVIIVLLIDQIASIAIHIGMKKALIIMQPYLEKLPEAEKLQFIQV